MPNDHNPTKIGLLVSAYKHNTWLNRLSNGPGITVAPAVNST
jgi:hypothetical protein